MKKRIILAAAALALAPAPLFAHGGLQYPVVEKNHIELEYTASRSVDRDPTLDDEQEHEWEVSYGVTDWWRPSFAISYDKAGSENLAFGSYEFGNLFQILTESTAPLALGAMLNYEHTPQTDTADAVEAMLMLAKTWGNTYHLANIVLEKEVGAGPKAGVEGRFIWSSRYSGLSEFFQPGFEWQSDLGELERMKGFNSQTHEIGPVIYGELPVGLHDDDAIEFRAGYLFGLSEQARGGQAVLQISYGMPFTF